MPKVLQASGVTGKVAIYEGTSEEPFTTPLSNIDKLYFHSDLNYVSAADKVTGTYTIPARNQTIVPYKNGLWFEHVLFPHGRPYAPFTIGKLINYKSVTLPLVGSIPLQMDKISLDNGTGGNAGTWQFIALASDLTNVVLMEYAYNVSDDYGTRNFFEPITLNYEIVVTDLVAGTTA